MTRGRLRAEWLNAHRLMGLDDAAQRGRFGWHSILAHRAAGMRDGLRELHRSFITDGAVRSLFVVLCPRHAGLCFTRKFSPQTVQIPGFRSNPVTGGRWGLFMGRRGEKSIRHVILMSHICRVRVIQGITGPYGTVCRRGAVCNAPCSGPLLPPRNTVSDSGCFEATP